jgi:glycosyltransferase involved in cell wall biosynthesis
VKRLRAVLVYIEPLPYVAALADELRTAWPGPIEVYYVTTNLTQPWNLALNNGHETVLPVNFLKKLRILWAVLRRDHKQTILHLAGWGHPILLSAMLMGRLLRIPIAVESDTPEGRPVQNWRRLLKKLFYPYFFRLPDFFLPAGTRQARYLGSYSVTEDRMVVAQMTVDVRAIRQFSRQDREGTRKTTRMNWATGADERLILYVGRLEPYKGIEVLLSAFGYVMEDLGGLRLVIVGDGSLRPSVESFAARAKNRIIYLERLFGYDVLRAYIAADFLVLPSLSESWGLVINEAMASSLPVIVSDQVGCLDDLVRHGETGLVVGAGNVSELASAMRQLAQDSSARIRMGRAAENLISNWTVENEAQKIVSAWTEMTR